MVGVKGFCCLWIGEGLICLVSLQSWHRSGALPPCRLAPAEPMAQAGFNLGVFPLDQGLSGRHRAGQVSQLRPELRIWGAERGKDKDFIPAWCDASRNTIPLQVGGCNNVPEPTSEFIGLALYRTKGPWCVVWGHPPHTAMWASGSFPFSCSSPQRSQLLPHCPLCFLFCRWCSLSSGGIAYEAVEVLPLWKDIECPTPVAGGGGREQRARSSLENTNYNIIISGGAWKC